MPIYIPRNPGKGSGQIFPSNPNYDAYQWWNPFDWFGQHDDTSGFKSADQNNLIRRARLLQNQKNMRRMQDPRIEKLRKRRMRMYDDMFSDSQGKIKDYLRASEGALQDSKTRGANARSRWEKMAFESRKFRDQALANWQQQYAQRQQGLSNVKKQTARLLNQIENAPSSVSEQAQQLADEKLRTATAVASASGGSAGTIGQQLLNQSNTQYADLMGSTSALRMKEKLGFLGARQDLLGQQAGTEMQMAKLAEADASQYAQNAKFISDQARTGANLDINISDQIRQAEAQNLKYLQQGQFDTLQNYLQKIYGFNREGQDIAGRDDLAFNRALTQRKDDRLRNYKLNQGLWGTVKGVVNSGLSLLGLGGEQQQGQQPIPYDQRPDAKGLGWKSYV